jgi:CheY-like chemotaxis protein/Tfp pilus assembly protein PilZ
MAYNTAPVMITILVLDDAQLILALHGSFLQRSDCRLSTATDRDEALEKAGRERPDLIILDGASGKWGLGCCRSLKADPALHSIPVVLLGAETDTSACADAGADAIVLKPVDRGRLVRALRGLVEVPLRGSVRRPLSTRVVYYRAGEDRSEERTGYLKDLGAGGAFVKTRERLEPGEIVQLIFDLPGESAITIRASGEVVRAVKPQRDSHLIPGVGLSFRAVGSRDHAAITSFAGKGTE